MLLTRRGWLYVCSGGLFVADLGLGLRCLVLARPKKKVSRQQIEEQLISMVTDARKSGNVMPAKLNVMPALNDVARDFIANPTVPDAKWMEDKLRAYGYSPMKWQTMGGAGATAADIFAKWMAKGEMQEQIMYPGYTDIGIAAGVHPRTDEFLVMVIFGKRTRLMPKEDKEENPK